MIFLSRWNEFVTLILGGAMDLEMKSFLEGFEQRMNVRFDEVREEFGAINKRIDHIDDRLHVIELRLNSLERNQRDTQEQVAFVIDRLGNFYDETKSVLGAYDFRLTHLEAKTVLR